MGQYTKPANKVVVAGEPLFEELQLKGTNLYPKRLMKRDADDSSMSVCGAGDNPIGWLGYEQAHPDFRPDKVDEAYKADAWAPRLHGGGFVLVARLAAGEVVTKGDYLVPAANGELKKAANLAIESGTTTVTSTAANGEIISGSKPKDGILAARAEESVDATAEAKDIMVTSLI